MTKLLQVFYFYYFQFNKYVVTDPDPHFATILSFGISQSFLINGLADFIALKYFCFEIEVNLQIGLSFIIIALNYLYFLHKKKGYQIIKSKPKIGESDLLSICCTLIFFVVTTSWLFWGSIYGKELIDKCKFK